MRSILLVLAVTVCVVLSGMIILPIEIEKGDSSMPFCTEQISIETRFHGGDGSAGNPYKISNITELQWMGNTTNLAKNFTLINDINALITKTWNSGAGFQPIAYDTSTSSYFQGPKFTGYLDGKGYNISDLYLCQTGNPNADQYVGLFGCISGRGVNDVHLVRANVTGFDMVGLLAGWLEKGQITNCSASGIVKGSAYYAGGIVSINNAKIINTSMSGNVTGMRNSGGLVGYSNGTIINCFASSNVVNSESHTGGLVGYLLGVVRNCSAIGTVNGSREYSGGLVGLIQGGMVYNCTAKVDVDGGIYVGGISGGNSAGSITNSYYNVNATKINGKHRVTNYAMYEEQYNDWLANDKSLDINDYLTKIPSTDYYELKNRADLRSLIAFPLETYKFKLTADIDLTNEPEFYIWRFSGREFEGNHKTISNLKITYSANMGTAFFCGVENGTTVSNLTLDNINITNVGKLGGLAGSSLGDIFNCNANVTITTKSPVWIVGIERMVGGLIGYVLDGTIQNCSAKGSIYGQSYIGGLVGDSSISLINCSANVTVNCPSWYVGGIAGQCKGKIINCTYVGNVRGNQWTGGLGGSCSDIIDCQVRGNISGGSWTGGVAGRCVNISNCHMNGNVSGSDNLGGLVGHIYSGKVLNCTMVGTVSSVSDMVGGLLGYYQNYDNHGAIMNCWSKGSVNGRDSIGGLIGINRAPITDCWAIGDVSGRGNIGGLVGNQSNMQYVKNCTSHGNVSASGNNVGGLIGTNNNEIYNCTAFGTNVTGITNNGGFIGYNTGTITNCWSLGDSNGTGDKVGGFIGYNIGTITNCSSMGNATGGVNCVGGFIGYSKGNIDNCSANGNALGTGDYIGSFIGDCNRMITNCTTEGNASGDDYIGGFIGRMNALGIIFNCHATGNVKGDDDVGGLVGWTYSPISFSTATGKVTADSATGGLIGYDDSSANILNCTAYGDVDAGTNAGGLIGVSNGKVINCSASGNVKGMDNNGGLVGLQQTGTILYCNSSGNVSGNLRVGGLVGWALGSINDCYSSCRNVTGAACLGGLTGDTDRFEYIIDSLYCINDTKINGGNYITPFGAFKAQYDEWYANDFYVDINNHMTKIGTTDYYEINDINDLKVVLPFALKDYKYKLTADIDLSSAPEVYVPVLLGKELVGNHKTISNLKLSKVYNNWLGMLGYGGKGVNITNVTILDYNITSRFYTGGLLGCINGSITNCTSIGNLNGYSYVGGLTGRFLSGTITNSYTTGNISSIDDYLGGLVGNANGQIDNCSSIVRVAGDSYTGGLIGMCAKSIVNSTSTSKVTGTSYVGGLVGYISGQIKDCNASWNVTASGGTVGGLAGQSNSLVIDCWAKGIVHGLNSVGGLIGNSLGNVLRCNYYGNITITGSSNLGGLVGYTTGSITNSNCTVDVKGSLDNVGGLVGYSDKSITNCFALGNVTGSDYVGGLVGRSAGPITSCYTIRNVTGIDQVGGLVGLSSSNIKYCNSSGLVQGQTYVGGLVGDKSGGSIEYCYSLGKIKGNDNVGGLIGRASGTILNCYSTGDVIGVSYLGGFIGRSTSGTISFSFSTGNVNGSSDYIGGFIGSNSASLTNCYATGGVNGSDDYIGGLLGSSTSGTITSCYSTGNVTGDQYVGGFIGYRSGGGDIINCYTPGNVIGKNDVGGLIGNQSGGGNINYCFTTGNISGSNYYIGGLVGYLQSGAIANCSSIGSIIGKRYTGGLVGWSNRPIACSISTGNVNGSDDFIGGLVGYQSHGDIINSYVTGSVNGDSYIGGFVGFKKNGTIKYSYSVGQVIGNSNVGGFVGYNKTGPISNSFWDNITSDRTTSSGGTGKNTTEMRKKTTFTSVGWDFTEIWNILEKRSTPFFIWNLLKLKAQNDQFSTSEDAILNVTTQGILENDIDMNFNSLCVTSYEVVSHYGASVTVFNDGKFIFNPASVPIFNALADDDFIIDFFNYTVTNVTGGFSNATVFINVTGLNDCPIIETVERIKTLEDAQYWLDFNASDVDNSDTMSWSLKSNATWLAINQQTGLLSGVPINSDVGTYWLNITVMDAHGGSDHLNYTLTVNNTPPIIINNDITEVMEGRDYHVDYNSSDDNQGTIKWTMNSNTTGWLTINSDTGLLAGKSENGDVGTYWVNVNVSDGNGGYDQTNFTLVVLNENDPPFLNQSIQDLSFPEDSYDTRIHLKDTFKDIDKGDVLTYHCEGQQNLTVTIFTNGTVKLEPKPNWNGIETLTFIANDSKSEVSDSVAITVTPVNDRPINNNFTYVIWTKNKNNITFVANPGVDVDNDVLTYKWDLNDGTTSQGFSFNHTYPKINISKHYTVMLTVFDGAVDSEICYQDVIIEAFIEPEPPVTDDDVTPDDDIDDDITPTNDTDHDGLPDSWEQKYFHNLDAKPGDDPDKDGLTNLEEYQQGKDPTKADNSTPDDDVDDDTDDDVTDDTSSNLGLIIGGIIAGVVILLIVVGIVVFLMMRKKKQEPAAQQAPGAPTGPTPEGQTQVQPAPALEQQPGAQPATAPPEAPLQPAAQPTDQAMAPAQDPYAQPGMQAEAQAQPGGDSTQPQQTGMQPILCIICGQATTNYPGQGNWCQNCHRYA